MDQTSPTTASFWKTVTSEDVHCPAVCALLSEADLISTADSFSGGGLVYLPDPPYVALTCTQGQSIWQAQMANTVVFSCCEGYRDQCT